MVGIVNGQEHGHNRYNGILSKVKQSPDLENTVDPDQQQQHSGKGKEGAPGQQAKRLLGGSPPIGFTLGNLVSLIAQGDLTAAQQLVDGVNSPPTPLPIVEEDSAILINPPELLDPDIIDPGFVDLDISEPVMYAANSDDDPTTTAPAEDPSILELFDPPQDSGEIN